MPQKHRLMWNHDNLYAENKRCREKSFIPSNIFTNNFVKVNFLVNFAVVSEEYGKSNHKAIQELLQRVLCGSIRCSKMQDKLLHQCCQDCG